MSDEAAKPTNKTVVVDGATYRVEDLPDAARQHIISIQLAEKELRDLQTRVAFTNAAKLYYGAQLKTALEGVKAIVEPVKG